MIEPSKKPRRIKYILDLLLGEGFSRRYPPGTVVYGQPEAEDASQPGVCIVPGGFFGEDYGTERSLPQLPLKEIDHTPLLYGSPEIRRHGSRLIVHADIIASAYFLVTRYEEMVRRDVRDQHGRFCGKESLPYRAGFIDRPIVDEYAELLRKWLGEVGIDVPGPERKFSVLLTHDIDVIRRYHGFPGLVRTTLSALLGHQPKRNILDCAATLTGLKKDMFTNFDEIIAIDAEAAEAAGALQMTPMYFFMAGGAVRYEGKYDIRSRLAGEAIRMVHESGAIVGLHPSHDAGKNPELIAAEKARLEEVCGFEVRHCRYHHLGWREIVDGWSVAAAGIDWDSTLGYPDVAGFRLGVCRPIQLFDPIRMEPFGIEEHPLVAMDQTLSVEKYMNLGEAEALEYCKRLIDQTVRHGGEFIMNWHNTQLAQLPAGYHRGLYRLLLNYLVESAG